MDISINIFNSFHLFGRSFCSKWLLIRGHIQVSGLCLNSSAVLNANEKLFVCIPERCSEETIQTFCASVWTVELPEWTWGAWGFLTDSSGGMSTGAEPLIEEMWPLWHSKLGHLMGQLRMGYGSRHVHTSERLATNTDLIPGFFLTARPFGTEPRGFSQMHTSLPGQQPWDTTA